MPRASGVGDRPDAGASPGPAVADVLRLARHSDRPTTLDYIRTVFDDFVELHGDRLYGDDPAIVGGPARLGDARVMVVGQQKGHSTPERIRRNFGMANPEGYRKALRLMRQAARLGLPVVTFIDTPGAHPGVGAEERGQARAIAESIVELARLPVPVVALIIGEGGSGGALALGVGDRVLMLENAYYSVISPEGCSAILWRDTGAALEAAEALGLQAPDLLRLGIVDAVVPEPPGGAHRDFPAAAANVRTAIIDSLEHLLPRPAEDLMASRYARFRSYGSEEPVRPISAVVGGWADEGRRRLATGSASRAVS